MWRFEYRNIEGQLFFGAQNFQMHLGATLDRHKPEGNVRNAFGRATIDGQQDIPNPHSRSQRRAPREHVGNNHAIVPRKIQGCGKNRRDGLNAEADLCAVNVADFAKLVIRDAHDIAWNGKAESFVSARLRQDESVDPNHFTVDIDQRPAGITGIDGRIGLNVGHRRVRIDLARDGRDHAEGDGITQALRAAKGQYNFTLADIAI